MRGLFLSRRHRFLQRSNATTGWRSSISSTLSTGWRKTRATERLTISRPSIGMAQLRSTVFRTHRCGKRVAGPPEQLRLPCPWSWSPRSQAARAKGRFWPVSQVWWYRPVLKQLDPLLSPSSPSPWQFVDPPFSRVLTFETEPPCRQSRFGAGRDRNAESFMAFNKSKALESALKFLNQGKVAQAIGEYQQILRHDPKDQATLMTVGDLFARQGDMTQAIEYFERLAQVYLSDGFNSKAIAIYKKIAKLAPAEMAPLERLADLYVQQGVLSEARPLFIQIAEAHLKANRSVKAVEVLHRLLEVEPENPRVQMRLAELYNVMGQKKEAAQTYLSYAQRLFERNENEEAQKLIDRALEVDATNPVAILLKGRILATLKKNDHAIKVLETHPEADAGAEVTDLIIDLE